MNRTLLFFVMTLAGLCACQTNAQVIVTSTPGNQVPSATAVTPTIVVTPTSTATPTAILTNTPLFYSTPFSLPSDVISPENIEDLHELAIFGKGKVNNFSYSPDGELLAIATPRGIYLYDAHAFLEKKFIPTDDSVNCVVFSPDGRMLASTFSKGSVRLWQVSDGMLLDILENNTGHSSGSLFFSPDGTLLFTGSADAAIRAWQISDGELMRTFRGSREYSADEMVDRMSVSPDGSLLATTDGSERVWIWRISTGELVHRLEGGHVAFSPNGKILAVARGYFQENQLVTLWRVPDWTLINTFKSHKGRILNLVFSPNGERLLINDNSGETQFWDLSNPPVSNCFQCEGRNFRKVLSFSTDGTNITTLDQDGILQVWNMTDERLLHTFNEHIGTIASIAFSQDGRFLATSSTSSASIWQIPDGMLLNSSPYKSYNYLSPLSIAFSPDSRFLAFGPFLGGLHLWNTDNSSTVMVWNDGRAISSIVISSDSTTLAIGIGIDPVIEFRQIPDGTVLGSLNIGGDHNADRMAFSQDNNLLAVARYGKVEIWRLSDKTLVHTLKGIGYWINQVAFSPTGNVFATGTLNTAQWNGSDGKQLQSLPIHGNAFSPDLSIVAEIERASVRFYRMSDGKLIRTLKFNYFIHDVEFSFDGKLIAVAGDEGTINIWGISLK